VTRPGFTGCLNCLWLPTCATSYQPSCFKRCMTSRLDIRHDTHFLHTCQVRIGHDGAGESKSGRRRCHRRCQSSASAHFPAYTPALFDTDQRTVSLFGFYAPGRRCSRNVWLSRGYAGSGNTRWMRAATTNFVSREKRHTKPPFQIGRARGRESHGPEKTQSVY
jgi:hypothetical protein